MGLRPKILDYNMFKRKHINDMDNELEKRLHNLEKTTDINNNTNKKSNKMLFIKNYLNNRFLRRFLQIHHYQYKYQYSFNTNINFHKIILQIILMTFLIFMLRITTINCLPVTSKPIENTPEHLAWEAWIMLPPPANSERHRKIMPKSIFVLPTNINNKNSHNLPIPQPQIQCPPGYRVDNSKCIPTISINRDQLLIDQLSNLLPVSTKPDDSSYDDYDYDYTNGDTINYDLDMLQTYNKQQSPSLINSNSNTFRVTEKDSEPLKINFSLDKFSIAKDENQNNNKNSNPSSGIKNDSNEFIMEINNDDSSENIKLRPFRDQETSSSTIKLSTTTNDATNKETQSNSTSTEMDTSETYAETKDENDTESILQQQYSTIFGRKESTTTSTTSTGNTETVSESNNSSTDSDTTELNENHQTESKRESTTASVTIDSTTTNFTENTKPIEFTTINNNKNTEISFNLSEFPNSNQNGNIFITTFSPIDSSTMVAILSSDENEMSSVVQNRNDFNSTTTSDYEYDQITTLNKNNGNTNQNENIEVITEQMVKEKNLIEKLSEESLVPDKSIEENTSTDISSEISLNQDEMTTNPPTYDDISSEIVDPSSSPLPIYNNIEKSSTESSVSTTATTKEIKKLNKTTEKNINVEKLEHKIVHVDRHRLHHKYHGIPQSTVSISASQPIEWHEDREPLMESIESNNRFVYHHLGSSPVPQSNSDVQSTQYISSVPENTKSNSDITVLPPSIPTAQPKRDTQADINEQLRIINMIVEENKRRAQATKIRFPEDRQPTSTQNPLRSHTLVRFPNESNQESTPYHIATSYYQPQNGRFDPEKLIFHRRFFQHQQQHATTQTPLDTTPAVITTTVAPDTQKPFWWLPSGWEIDQNGDRPMLIRFWSRSPSRNSEQFTSNTEPYIDQYRTASSNTHHIITDNLQRRDNENYNVNHNKNINYNINTSDGLYSQQPSAATATTTTSRYRANSRSPTDNLYHEVPSSQNVYKVLNAARQWKNSKR